MALKLNSKYLSKFINEAEYEVMADQLKEAHTMLHNKTGKGNEFTGWLTLPTDYDKEEYSRIKRAAKKIRSNTDIFIVIGIGGSYLGARAVIELLKSQNYNLLNKYTPDIYFNVNNIISTALS